ncbi:MAG: hypothetical protein M3Y81_14175 [Chloroflexota bacterium]|nr:hypothetical protein [Chloroflexota bacterium]
MSSEYKIPSSTKPELVEAWSIKPLQFTPKEDCQKHFKSELQTEIRKLQNKPNKTFYALLATPLQKSEPDLENVLFYNVGPAFFRHLITSTSRVRFERSFSLPISSGNLETNFSCYQCYSFLENDTSFLYWRKSQPLAQWEPVEMPPLSSSTNPGTIWYELKKHPLQYISESRELPSHFGLRITLTHPPFAENRNPASLIKPLLDGVIVSFHAHTGEDIEELSRKLEQILQKPAGSLAFFLTDKSRAVLGVRPLFIKRQDPYKSLWNPADDRCKAVEIFLREDHARKWSLSGELFTVEYVSETQKL